MKNILSAIAIVFVGLLPASAQKNAGDPFSIDPIEPVVHPAGNSNYQAALSEDDFKNQRMVFYTDSNATVAYMHINGSVVRLTGGPNEENILAYSSKNYTVTFSTSKKESLKNTGDADDRSVMKVQGTITIYNSQGKVISRTITGKLLSAAKN